MSTSATSVVRKVKNAKATSSENRNLSRPTSGQSAIPKTPRGKQASNASSSATTINTQKVPALRPTTPVSTSKSSSTLSPNNATATAMQSTSTVGLSSTIAIPVAAITTNVDAVNRIVTTGNPVISTSAAVTSPANNTNTTTAVSSADVASKDYVVINIQPENNDSRRVDQDKIGNDEYAGKLSELKKREEDLKRREEALLSDQEKLRKEKASFKAREEEFKARKETEAKLEADSFFEAKKKQGSAAEQAILAEVYKLNSRLKSNDLVKDIKASNREDMNTLIAELSMELADERRIRGAVASAQLEFQLEILREFKELMAEVEKLVKLTAEDSKQTRAVQERGEKRSLAGYKTSVVVAGSTFGIYTLGSWLVTGSVTTSSLLAGATLAASGVGLFTAAGIWGYNRYYYSGQNPKPNAGKDSSKEPSSTGNSEGLRVDTKSQNDQPFIVEHTVDHKLTAEKRESNNQKEKGMCVAKEPLVSNAASAGIVASNAPPTSPTSAKYVVSDNEKESKETVLVLSKRLKAVVDKMQKLISESSPPASPELRSGNYEGMPLINLRNRRIAPPSALNLSLEVASSVPVTTRSVLLSAKDKGGREDSAIRATISTSCEPQSSPVLISSTAPSVQTASASSIVGTSPTFFPSGRHFAVAGESVVRTGTPPVAGVASATPSVKRGMKSAGTSSNSSVNT